MTAAVIGPVGAALIALGAFEASHVYFGWPAHSFLGSIFDRGSQARVVDPGPAILADVTPRQRFAPAQADGLVDAGYRGQHRGGHGSRNTCPPGTEWNSADGICYGQPYTVQRPRPRGEGWVPYHNGPLDNGWVRRKCIANC